ncbi:AAA family ATPase [Leyella stercorea]
MEEIVKHINDTNASFRQPNAGDAKNTDLFLDNEHYSLFKDSGEQITVRYSKENLTKAILFIASILPRKFDQSATHELIKFSKEFVLDQLAIIDALFTVGGRSVNSFTQVWNARKDVPQKNGKIDKRFYFNGLLKDVLYTDYKGVQRKTKFTIRNYFAGGYSDLHILKADDGIFDIRISNANVPTFDNKEDGLEEVAEQKKEIKCLQQIYYGAPGTGKSFEVKDTTKRYSTIRTTFHPDSDYSTFVGAYKPVMEETPVYGAQGVEVAKEKRITYSYVKQAFLKAYLGAWQKYSKGGETAEPQFLVIEEINRGNCAQIFGDLFQLLDRSDNGFSTYPIEADSDLQNEIKKAFAEGGEYAIENGLDVDDAVDGYTSNYGETLSDDIKNGRVLLLPNNLYIWATMNTSAQSLFPIDSAFKRRWDWRYVKIADAGKGWKIKCGTEYCDWWTFVEEINKKIAKETSSDDKKLGYFFCKPDKNGNTISEDKFVGKVLFYLWNDVFKDGDTSLFKVGENTEEATFEAFYNDDNTVNIEAIRKFLVAVVGDNNIKSGNEEGPSPDGNPSNGIDYTKYSFNGETRLSKKDIGYKIVMKYINEHSDKTFEELQKNLAFDESVDNKYRYKGVLAKVEDINGSYQDCFSDERTSSDGVNYKVLTWWNKYNIDFIINFAKKQGWSVDKETE